MFRRADRERLERIDKNLLTGLQPFRPEQVQFSQGNAAELMAAAIKRSDAMYDRLEAIEKRLGEHHEASLVKADDVVKIFKDVRALEQELLAQLRKPAKKGRK